MRLFSVGRADTGAASVEVEPAHPRQLSSVARHSKADSLVLHAPLCTEMLRADPVREVAPQRPWRVSGRLEAAVKDRWATRDRGGSGWNG